MAIRHGIASSSVALTPIVTISSVSNYNQNRAQFNAQIDNNGYTGTVYFDYSTSSTFTSYTTVSFTNINRGSTGVSYSATGLTEGTLYYVRCRAANDVGTITSGSVSFTTWSLQVYERTTAGGTTFTIPTITPAGGSAIAVSIYDIIMFGGGGGGTSFQGSGGGGYISQASQTLTGNRSITTSVGAGGAGVVYNTSEATSGGNSTISGDITTLTANGGSSGANTNGVAQRGWSSGNGNLGGTGQGYDWVSDKYNFTNGAGGGGGGAGGAGGNGTANNTGTYGGNGGIGVSITRGGVTREGGAGGPGAASNLDGGPAYAGSTGTYNTYGSGGNCAAYLGNGSAGQAGYIRFRYYAASALA